MDEKLEKIRQNYWSTGIRTLGEIMDDNGIKTYEEWVRWFDAHKDAVFCHYDCRLAAGNLHSKPMCLKCLKGAVDIEMDCFADFTPESPEPPGLENQIAVNTLYIASALNNYLSGKTIQSVEPGDGYEAGWVVINFAPKEGEDYRTFMTVWVGGDRGSLDPVHHWDMALHYTNGEGGSVIPIYRSWQPQGPEYLRLERCEEAAEFVAKWEVKKNQPARTTKAAYLAACERVRTHVDPSAAINPAIGN